MLYAKQTQRRPFLKTNAIACTLAYSVPGEDGGYLDRIIDPPHRWLFNYGSAQHGVTTFDPFDRVLASWREPSVEGPEGGKYTVLLPVFSPALGYFDWAFVGALATGVATGLLNEVEAAPECAGGMEPVIDYLGFNQITMKSGPSKGKTFGAVRLQIVGWMPRPAFFGPACNPPPQRMAALTFDSAVQMPHTGADGSVKLQPVGTSSASTRRNKARERAPQAAKGGGPLLDDAIPFGPEAR